jgi:hypothetical protein
MKEKNQKLRLQLETTPSASSSTKSNYNTTANTQSLGTIDESVSIAPEPKADKKHSVLNIVSSNRRYKKEK